MKKNKLISQFGEVSCAYEWVNKALLGNKGANLVEMSRLGLPVPPGFVITTEVCLYFQQHGSLPHALDAEITRAIKDLECLTGKQFGGKSNPLLVSVRSGASVSMPGMMDTILNLGMNDAVVDAMCVAYQDQRFVFDTYRRFLEMYATLVMNVDRSHIPHLGHHEVADIAAIRANVNSIKAVILQRSGVPMEEEPDAQLRAAIASVATSWNSERAITYRKLHGIDDSLGTAVVVQAMVFGNLGQDSATGVAFTRDPSTGERKLYGEFLHNAQGEEVVSGTRTPLPINDHPLSLEIAMPDRYKELLWIGRKLERHYKDMQDIEFTIEQNKLWMLQTRTGKRSAASAVKIAMSLLEEGVIDKKTAILRIDPLSLDQLLHPTISNAAAESVLTCGLPASPGAASGVIVFSPKDAEKIKKDGRSAILVRLETSPEDIAGMSAASGILTSRGGMTSHAAVVARGMGKPCVTGASELVIDQQAQMLKCGAHSLHAGEVITIDGSSGRVFLGAVPMVKPQSMTHLSGLMKLASDLKVLKVRCNAETVQDVRAGLEFGAEGIGLCRTEHMFFEEGRVEWVRSMFLSTREDEFERALLELEKLQREDFRQIFMELNGKPINIRLLDMPLHEFLPHSDAELELLARKCGKSASDFKVKLAALRETNPMLGHRGARLGITHPAIYEMQVRAIVRAYSEVISQGGVEPKVEIMVPLIVGPEELLSLKARIERILNSMPHDRRFLKCEVGAMVELPRAALTSGAIAEHAAFLSYGTNDLSQATYGISRDDAGSFMRQYMDAGIFKRDPFASLDVDGVGELIKISALRARKVNAFIKLGVCGEHAGDPRSIAFFHRLGLDYISCSPYRIPIACLAAAQAAVLKGKMQ